MTGPRKRRALLRAGAIGIAGLAGCAGGLGGDPSDGGPGTEGTTDGSAGTTAEPAGTTPRTTRESTDATTSATDSPPAEVAPRSVRSSFFYLVTPDQMDVAATEGRQFAFVTVTPDSDASPSPGEFALVADGREFPATTTPGPITNPYYLYDQKHVYDPDESRAGWLAFEVPNPLDAERAGVAFGDYERSIDEEFAAALRAPPAEFELASFDAPERVTPDETVEVSFAVRNVGAADGTFRACLNETGPSHVPHPVELSVPAGERRERSWTFGSRLGASTGSVQYRFLSPAGDRDVTVEVASGGGTTTGE